MVNFAVTRVIAALFLKSTLEVAAREKEKVANEARSPTFRGVLGFNGRDLMKKPWSHILLGAYSEP